MTTDKKPETDGPEKTYVAVFTTSSDKGPKVELFNTMSKNLRAPVFDGKIGDQRVSAFLREGPKGNFFGLAGEKDAATGMSKDLGTAKIGTRKDGSPIFVIDLKNDDGTKETIFASISKKVSNERLAEFGLNLETQAGKRAAVAAKAVSEDAPEVAKKPAPKP